MGVAPPTVTAFFQGTADGLLAMTDNDVNVAIRGAAHDAAAPGHEPARRIAFREHFRQVYEPESGERAALLEPGARVFAEVEAEFGAGAVWRDRYSSKRDAQYDSPVYSRQRRIDSSVAISGTLARAPAFAVDCVYARPELRLEIEARIECNRGQWFPAPK